MFYEKIIIQEKLIFKKDNILIGVSGGPDSMSLLHFMMSIKEKYSLSVSVAHINHHTRKNENNIEQEMIEELCIKNEIPLYIGHFQKKTKRNFHEEARSFRYRFFYHIANKIKVNKIVLAHHQDDQVETILFKITRGNNINGYMGMKKELKINDNISVIRPLLDLSKEEVLKYCNENEVPYMIDSSNLSNKYTRNYIRNNIIPLFKNIQPDFNNKIMQFHEQIKEVNDYLQENSIILTNEMIILHKEDRIVLDLIKLKKNHRALIRVILINIVNLLYKDKFILTYEKIKNIINIIFNQKPNITFNLGKNMYCVKEYDKLTFRIGMENFEDFQVVIDSFKDYLLPNGMKICVEKVEEKAKINNKTLFLCYNSSVWPLLIRTKKNGDLIKTKIGKKKISRIFIDAKIPSNLRKKWPLLVDEKGEIIWVIGIQKPDFSNSPNCQQYIKIEVID